MKLYLYFIIKKITLNELGLFNSRIPVSAESDLFIRLYSNNYKYVKVPVNFVSYRCGGISTVNMNQSRIDHSLSFYNNVGKLHNLTYNNCYDLWQFSFLEEKNLLQQISLILKVPIFLNKRKLLYMFLKSKIKKIQNLTKKISSKIYKSAKSFFYN